MLYTRYYRRKRRAKYKFLKIASISLLAAVVILLLFDPYLPYSLFVMPVVNRVTSWTSPADLKSNFKHEKNLSVSNRQRCFLLYNTLPEDLVRLLQVNVTQIKWNNTNNVCQRFLTIDKGVGRIGNKMFELAALIGLACEYDFFPILPIRKFFSLPTYFDLPNQANIEPNRIPTVKCIGDKYATYYNCSNELKATDQGLLKLSSRKLMQSWKYFQTDKCEHFIRKMFQLKPKYITKAKEFLMAISKNGSQTVCIHIRRGDMVTEAKLGYTVVNSSFILNAQQYYIQKYKNVIFVILSDDMTWCKENIKTDVHYSPFNNPGDDMALMTLCDHVTVTSGTFGWWGAWLSRGTTVYFKGFTRPDSRVGKGLTKADYYPPRWIPL